VIPRIYYYSHYHRAWTSPISKPGKKNSAEYYVISSGDIREIGVHSALVRINEELLERKVAAPV
jgi:hypothetical protein